MTGILDVFHQDPFTTIQLTSAIEKVPYVPDGLEAMEIFEDKPIRTEQLAVEERQGQLVIVPFTDRGAPGSERTTELRNARSFKVPRLRLGDTIYARELAGIREFGQETVLMQVQSELGRRLVGPTGIRNNLRYTQEFHRLAAVQGKLLDANGSVLYNWFDEFRITPNAEIPFNLLAKTTGSLRPLCNAIVRSMKRKAQGAFTLSTRVQALCGDGFWDALVTHPDVEKTYLNWAEATELRKGTAFENYTFSDIDWQNYRGSDDELALAAAATNGSGVLTLGTGSIGLVSVGWAVSGPGIPMGATIGSINSGAGTATLAGGVLFGGATGTYTFNFGGGIAAGGGGTISIPSNAAVFFPKKAPGIFQRALAPADSVEWVNTLGKPEYVQMIFDRDRNEWVRAEMTVYPLHICTRPEVLFTGTMDAAAD